MDIDPMCKYRSKKRNQRARKRRKSPQHRGLVKIDPDLELAKKHIAKAEHNLKAISAFKTSGFSDWSITAGFYCVYHCFLAIAVKFGYETRNQSCTISLIKMLKEEGKIEIDQKHIDQLEYDDTDERHESTVIESREEFTYGIEVTAGNPKIQKLIDECKELLDVTKEIIFK